MKINDVVAIPQINDTNIYVGVVIDDMHFSECTVLVGKRREVFPYSNLELLGKLKNKKECEAIMPGSMILFDNMTSDPRTGIVKSCSISYKSSELSYLVLIDKETMIVSGHQIKGHYSLGKPHDVYPLYNTDAAK